ncbi:MAG TPA: molybdopterin-guanine dinucleotide biosynthesis protein B [Methanomicrobiales archaeon]|nr:molybdopterin-guanine dinucleotide biosynthesis protein B [Methanomicrobiales archaeon]
MKVIPVAGLSGSGKTTFIRNLIPLLREFGPVGTVKHAGRHGLDLPPGKDTTVMFGAGAAAVAGIDGEKMLLTLGDASLATALDILSERGVATAVVEGWKSIPWPKVVIGDLETDGCILRNPGPAEVIRQRDRFPDYFTVGEILRELGEGRREKGQACTTATATIPLPAGLKEDSLSSLESALPGFVNGMKNLPGAPGVRAAIRRGSLVGGTDEILIAVAAGSGEEAATVLQIALSRLRKILDGTLIPVRRRD